jgi:hypothetical protein
MKKIPLDLCKIIISETSDTDNRIKKVRKCMYNINNFGVQSPLCFFILKTLRCNGKAILIIKSVSFLSTAFVQNSFYSNTNLASYI